MVKTKGDEESSLSKWLIAFFLIVVVGSSIVEILNLFSRTKDFDDEE
jgi:hypothetical protein